MPIQPFEVHVPEAILVDLRERLSRARIAEIDDGAGWDAGTSPRYLLDLLRYWNTQFDWRRQEASINRFSHFRAAIDGLQIHFIHERGRGDRPLPLLLTHGYPDSFLRFQKLIPLLTDPAAHGGNAADAFDVDRFGAHGGDWGSTVTEHLARSHAGAVVGIHLTDVPFWHAFQRPHELTPAEEKFLAANGDFQKKEGAYAMIQGTRPGTLAQGLNDSPIGLAAWIVEKFHAWSDCHGDVESRFTKDEILANIMVYWATGTIASSFSPYYDFTHAGAMRWILEKAKEWVGSSKVPAGFALFPGDIVTPPREWAERFYNVQRWTPMPRGGHFAALEEPELLAEEVRAFFRPLREV
jgi:pimeloyl-ACP methyl ester carboxylesterase